MINKISISRISILMVFAAAGVVIGLAQSPPDHAMAPHQAAGLPSQAAGWPSSSAGIPGLAAGIPGPAALNSGPAALNSSPAAGIAGPAAATLSGNTAFSGQNSHFPAPPAMSPTGKSGSAAGKRSPPESTLGAIFSNESIVPSTNTRPQMATAGDLIGFSHADGSGNLTITLVHTGKSWMSVYHVDSEGTIRLASSRPLDADFSLQLNATDPLPEDIRAMNHRVRPGR